MKRLGVIVAMMAMAITVTFAQGKDNSKGVSFERLSSYLQLKPNQVDKVYKINEFFVNQLGQPLSSESLFNNDRSKEEIENALIGNLSLMKRALTDEQYEKYVALINVTRENHKIEDESPALARYLSKK